MRYRVLAGWVVGLSLTAALASVDCGGDDTSGTGTAGSSGKGGSSATGGHGGTGGSGGASTSTGGGGSGGGGTGGTAGSGGKGGSGGSTDGGKGGGGTAGTGGAGGATDGGTDAPQGDAQDGATPDVSAGDASDAARMVAFSEVLAILQSNKCVSCHKSNDGAVTGLFDFQTTDGLYARLTAPLPDGQEGTCGFGDGGTDGGDGGDASRPNHTLVVPTDTDGSFLYLKITGRQIPGNPPGGCGQHMPRVRLFADDGGPAGSIGCDQADGGAAVNCLSQTEIDTIGNWITQGAQEFPPD
jgi:hypothetical protein